MRPELETIAQWIRPESQVLDLGCGDGELLHHLAQRNKVWGVGMEIDHANIEQCIRKGVNVIKLDLNVGLRNYFTKETFDYVVMTQTLQAIRHPARLLDEMLAIGSVGIVTFPNMGHWHCRWQLAKGRMPVTRALPSTWHDTDNIHLCTIADFEDLCADKNIHIQRRELSPGQRVLPRVAPNVFAETAIYQISSDRSNTL